MAKVKTHQNGSSPAIEPLTDQQAQAIPFLVAGVSQRATAESVGVDEATVSRWLNSRDYPQFQAAYNAARAAAFQAAQDRLGALFSRAADMLIELMDTGDEQTRLKIALAIIKNGPPAVGETDAARLVKLWQIEQEEARKELVRREMFNIS